MVGGNWICGAIGFVLGGLLGGYFVGRHFAAEYRDTIKSLQEENEQLRDQLRKKTEKGLAEREKAVEKAEKKLDKNLSTLKKPKVERIDIRPEKPSTAEIERLSEEYRSDAFNAHFADRVAPDDSDDVGDEEEGDGDRFVNFPAKVATLTTKAFAEAYARASKNPVDFASEEDDEDHLVNTPVDDDENRRDLSIRMIDKETFKHDIEIKDSDTYTYYQEDGVLVNDITQEVEPDQAGVLGEDAMEIIDNTEQDELYIDNEPDNMLYDIVVDHNMSYYRDALGC